MWRRAGLAGVLVCALSTAVAPAAHAAGTWQPPVDVSAAGEIDHLRVAADRVGGGAVVVWRRWDRGDQTVQAAVRSQHGAFGAPLDLSLGGGLVAKPQVAMNARGDAIVVWERWNGTNGIVQATIRPAGGDFAAPVDLSQPGQHSGDPQVAIDAAGNTFVVWQRVDDSSTIAQAVTGSITGEYSPVVDLSSADRIANAPQIAVNAAGEALAVWATYGSSPELKGVQAASRPAGGSFSAPVTVSGGGAVAPQVAVADSGEAVVVWSLDAEGPTPAIATAVRPAASSSWAITATFADGDAQRVAMAPDGDTVAVWRDVGGPDPSSGVVGSQRAPGGPFSGFGWLSTRGNADGPQVAIDECRASAVVWHNAVDGGHRVEASVREGPGAFSAPTLVSGPGQLAFEPQVAMTGGGGAVAVFVAGAGLHQVVQAAAYRADEPAR